MAAQPTATLFEPIFEFSKASTVTFNKRSFKNMNSVISKSINTFAIQPTAASASPFDPSVDAVLYKLFDSRGDPTLFDFEYDLNIKNGYLTPSMTARLQQALADARTEGLKLRESTAEREAFDKAWKSLPHERDVANEVNPKTCCRVCHKFRSGDRVATTDDDDDDTSDDTPLTSLIAPTTTSRGRQTKLSQKLTSSVAKVSHQKHPEHVCSGVECNDEVKCPLKKGERSRFAFFRLPLSFFVSALEEKD